MSEHDKREFHPWGTVWFWCNGVRCTSADNWTDAELNAGNVVMIVRSKAALSEAERVLLAAYNTGYAAAKADVRKALGI